MPIYPTLPADQPQSIDFFGGKVPINPDSMRTQAVRWSQSGDPQLQSSATRAGNFYVFPDGSRIPASSWDHFVGVHNSSDFHRAAGSGSQYDEWARELGHGQNFDYNGPQVFGNFLSAEEAPGGFLAPANQAVATAAGTRAIFDTGRAQRQQTLSSLSASGLAPRYASDIANQGDEGTIVKANEFLGNQTYQSGQNRFQATLEWLNSSAQAVNAGLQAKKNLELAQQEAKRRSQGAILAVAGAAVGGYFGGPAGAAAGGEVGRSVGSGGKLF